MILFSHYDNDNYEIIYANIVSATNTKKIIRANKKNLSRRYAQ